MERPFLDANVLFSAAYKPNSDFQALWQLSQTALHSSARAAREAEAALAAKHSAALPLLAQLLQSVTIVPEPASSLSLPAGMFLPAKDEPIFLAAVQAQATHFLTGDMKHFGPYFGQTLGGVLVLRPASYLQHRQASP